jgi:Ni/Co efflux regulator RcnB
MASLLQKKLGAYSAYYFEDPTLIASRQQSSQSKCTDKHKNKLMHMHHDAERDKELTKATSSRQSATNDTVAFTKRLATLEPQTTTQNTYNKSFDRLDPAHLYSGTRMANKYRKLQSSSKYEYRELLDTAVLPVRG